MDTNIEKQLQKLRVCFEKKQTSKAIALAAQLLKKLGSDATALQVFAICNEFQQFDFVLHALKNRLHEKTDTLLNLELYADTVKQRSFTDAAAAQAALIWLASYIEKILPNINNASGLIYKLSILLGYSTTSDRVIVVNILNAFLAPLLKAMLKAGMYTEALALEPFAYDIYVKQEESEVAFGQFMNLVAEDMRSAGKRFAESHPLATTTTQVLHENEPYRVAFVIHTSSTLAHIGAMLGFFEGLRELDDNLIEPVVFSFSGHNVEMLEQCQRLQVKVVSLDEPGLDLCGKILLLREKLAAEACHTTVWLCLANWMCFCLAFRLSAVQIWWSMKYHDFSSPDIDGYICRFVVDSSFYNGQWRGGYITLPKLFDTEKADDAQIIRQQFENKVILGTMGRAELINDERFLQAVIRVLQENPDTVYLWTGREEDPDIVAVFAQANMLQRTKFIGWVDTKLYAQVLDVYLDVFGFGTGFTLIETMAASKPVVFLDEKRDFSVLSMLRGMINSAYIKLAPEQTAVLNTLTAKNADEYVSIVRKLIASPQARDQAGSLLAEMASTFENKKLSARIYQQHINDIVANKLRDNIEPALN